MLAAAAPTGSTTRSSAQDMVSRIDRAVREHGPAPGAKRMMQLEDLAATLSIETGVYGVWRPLHCPVVPVAVRQTQSDGGRGGFPQLDFCARIGPASRCFCGHAYGEHGGGFSPAVRPTAARPRGGGCRRGGTVSACQKCACTDFAYVPSRPEEVGEWWLPRRKNFNIHEYRVKCRCGHTHVEHDPAGNKRCRACACGTFVSAFRCITCEGLWEDHETVFETEEERKAAGRVVGEAFRPLVVGVAGGVGTSTAGHGAEDGLTTNSLNLRSAVLNGDSRRSSRPAALSSKRGSCSNKAEQQQQPQTYSYSVGGKTAISNIRPEFMASALERMGIGGGSPARDLHSRRKHELDGGDWGSLEDAFPKKNFNF